MRWDGINSLSSGKERDEMMMASSVLQRQRGVRCGGAERREGARRLTDIVSEVCMELA